jgi:hypothetical protein
MTEKRVSSARRRLRRGDAAKYIGGLETIHPGSKVFICCRVSGRQQKGNLQDQEKHLRGIVKKIGAIVIDVVRQTGSGLEPDWLNGPAIKAIEQNAVLLAESTSRFIRNPCFDSVAWPDAQARETDLQDLHFATLGAQLVTAVDPNASPELERSVQRKRGQRAKNRKGGRPKTTQPRGAARREARLDEVIRLQEEGLPIREITKRVNQLDDGFQDLWPATVWRWMQRYGQGG